MEPPSRPAVRAVTEPGQPARQRWRLVLARSLDAPRITGRELSDAWEMAVESTGLPLHRAAGRVRTRIAFGAPLQLGVAGERELADLFMAERVPAWRVREELDTVLPPGWRLVDLYDVWVGGPPLAGRVLAADYRVELEGKVDPVALAAAAHGLLDATELRRVRSKGDASVAYDLRPLLADVAVLRGSPVLVRVRTRMHPQLGTGRPEEVIGALGDRLGQPLQLGTMVRERLILAGDPG